MVDSPIAADSAISRMRRLIRWSLSTVVLTADTLVRALALARHVKDEASAIEAVPPAVDVGSPPGEAMANSHASSPLAILRGGAA